MEGSQLPSSFPLTALFEVGPGVLTSSTVRGNKQVKQTPGCYTHGEKLFASVRFTCLLIGLTDTRTHHQRCMRSTTGRTATGSVCRQQRSISCSAKPYLALQFKFRLHLRPHTPWPCVTAEGKARAAGPVCESGGAHHGERGWASWDCWY